LLILEKRQRILFWDKHPWKPQRLKL